MSNTYFDNLCEVIRDRSGIVLNADKAYLVENRLSPIARRHDCSNVQDFLHTLRTSRDESVMRDVIDALTTNESFFFRDEKPFKAFREVTLPHLMEARAARKRIRIWCAACSSGQEPFSLAMILHEMKAQFAGWHIDIVGTDLSSAILERARKGEFTQFEVQRGLSDAQLKRYFTQNGNNWTVLPEIRSMVDFRPFNLLESPHALGKFDIVFCRNVLIYFDQQTKERVLSSIVTVSESDAFLALGASETMIGLSNAYDPVPGGHSIDQIKH